MTESNLLFAKIVANPSTYSWSQVYSAGKLFAVLSLETNEENKEKDYLNVLGKEILDTLEQEFFSLEEKSLESIGQAVLTTSKKIPEDIFCSLTIGVFVNNILYVYILGNGKVSLKRAGNLGNLLESADQKSTSIKQASGFLEDNDVLILQTKQFSNIISIETLSEFLDDLPPSEAAENIAPLIHEKEESGAAAIIINYKTPVNKAETLAPLEEEQQKDFDQEKVEEKSPFYSSSIKRDFNFSDKIKPLFAKMPKQFDLNHPRKVILTIVVVIIIVLLGSIVFAVKKQQSAKIQAAFESVYPEAQKQYGEGQGLIGLNQNLARDNFSRAQKILEEGKNKLPKNSKEAKQILELLAKVNSALNSTSGVIASQARQVDTSLSSFLLAQTKNDGLYFAYDDKNIYGLTADSVYSLNKDGTNKKTAIKNDDFWQNPAGLSPYNGNIYVLDKKQNQILKFVATSDGFSKTNYFQSTNPDFSKAAAMAIDSSVYVLISDGSISKFTKGNADNFSAAGLDKPLSNPKKIFTDANTDNIYILDNGNSRIVVLDKNGGYKSQYQADVIKNAKDFDVLEKDKKVYVLSNGKVYQINLK